MRSSVILLSGGLDSSTLAYYRKAKGDHLIGLSFDYRQRHQRELACAVEIAHRLEIEEHYLIDANVFPWVASPLTGQMSVPVDRHEAETARVAPTYVPARNIIFLSIALSLAESRGCDSILIGAHEDDERGYPDCRSEFLAAFQSMAWLGTRAGTEEDRKIEIRRPFIGWRKRSIVAEGLRLGVPYEQTWTCYQGEKLACGHCDSCRQRLAAFAFVGEVDPLPYAESES